MIRRICFTLFILNLLVACKETSEKKSIEKEVIAKTNEDESSKEIIKH